MAGASEHKDFTLLFQAIDKAWPKEYGAMNSRSQENGESIERLMNVVLHGSEKQLKSTEATEHMVPALAVLNKIDELQLVAMPQLLHSDVRMRRLAMFTVAPLVKHFDAAIAMLAREVWVVLVQPDPSHSREEALDRVKHVIPSQDDRRQSVLLVDLATPGYSVNFMFKIDEGGGRDLILEPMQTAITRIGDEFLVPESGMIDIWPTATTPEIPEGLLASV